MGPIILVIEDEENIRDNIKVILESELYEVKTAQNGNEGIEYAKLYKPDLIICDIMMPGIDGYEVLIQLTSDENYYVPFIFLTARVDRKDLRKGMELGADDYIFKPFTSKELVKAVNTRLAKLKRIITKVTLGDNTFSKSDKIGLKESILVKYHKKVFPIKVKEIVHIKAENQYSQLYYEFNKNYLIRKSLNDWMKILPDNYFIRISRSMVINKEFMENVKILNNGTYKIIIKNTEEEFSISRNYLNNVKSNFTIV